MKTLCLAILMLISSCSFSQFAQIQFQEKFSDTTPVKIESILIVGAGSAATRVFLDDLSSNIIEALKRKSINSQYYFAGKDTGQVQSFIDTLNTSLYTAIVFLLPDGSSSLQNESSTITTAMNSKMGRLTTLITNEKYTYRQNFKFMLCLPAKDFKKIWSASVELQCDIIKSLAGKKISKKILSAWKDKKYIR